MHLATLFRQNRLSRLSSKTTHFGVHKSTEYCWVFKPDRIIHQRKRGVLLRRERDGKDIMICFLLCSTAISHATHPPSPPPPPPPPPPPGNVVVHVAPPTAPVPVNGIAEWTLTIEPVAGTANFSVGWEVILIKLSSFFLNKLFYFIFSPPFCFKHNLILTTVRNVAASLRI